jgi:hypothetical protein
MNHSISGPPAAPPLSMTGNQVIVQTLLELGVDTVFGYIGASVNPVISQGFNHSIINSNLAKSYEKTRIPADNGLFWARNFGPPQGRRSKRTGGVFENTLRIFLTENAATGQKGCPKQNSCEISGLGRFLMLLRPFTNGRQIVTATPNA